MTIQQLMDLVTKIDFLVIAFRDSILVYSVVLHKVKFLLFLQAVRPIVTKKMAKKGQIF